MQLIITLKNCFIAFAVIRRLISAAAECGNSRPPHNSSGSEPEGFSSAQLANIPTSVCVAATARRSDDPRAYRHAWRCYHHTWRYRHAWRAVIRAAVVAVATAAAIRAAVKARSTTTSDRNCQTGLFERRERHGLGGGNAEETDADGHSETKTFSHSFLLGVSSKQHTGTKRKGQAVGGTWPKTTAFFGHFGDAVSIMFGAALPSPHVKKISDCKIFVPILAL